MASSGKLRSSLGYSIKPAALEIQNVQAGAAVTASVTIKNEDTKVRSFRVKPPKTGWFTVTGLLHPVQLAPGLETTFQVTLDAASLDRARDFHDVITVQSDADSTELQVRALAPRPDVTVTGDLCFGIVAAEVRVERQLTLLNRSRRPVAFKLEPDRSLSGLLFEPEAGVLGPAGSGTDTLQVTAALRSSEAAALAADVALTLSDGGSRSSGGGSCGSGGAAGAGGGSSSSTKQMLSCSATVVQQTVQVLDGAGSPVHKVDLGCLYYGESLEQTIRVFNNGPVKSNYVLTYGTVDDMGAADRTMDELETDPNDPHAAYLRLARMKAKIHRSVDSPVSISPLTGIIEPFSEALLTVRFAPRQPHLQRGFTAKLPPAADQRASFDYVAQLDLEGLQRPMRFPVVGAGALPALSLEPTALHFGEVPTYDWADQLLTVTNRNSELPIDFRIPKRSPYYSCEPSRGLLLPGQSATVLVRYCPKALGRHPAAAAVQMLSQRGVPVGEVTCQLFGAAEKLGCKPPVVGGPDKAPDDFLKPKHFVDEEMTVLAGLTKKRTFHRQQLWENPETLKRLDTVGDADPLAYTKSDRMLQSQHDDRYTEFIRAGRTAKKRHYLTRPVGDNDLDLGMTAYSGLRPPELPPSKVVEPLWTVQRANDGSPTYKRHVATAAAIAKMPLYRDKPEGEVEAAQCSAVLSSEQLAQIVVGPKVIDFGKVSLAMQATQHFTVYNPLRQAVRVVLDLRQLHELVETKHVSQVIPPGCTGKFPIVFQCHDVRSFLESVDYCINGCCFHSFEVAAQVVPVTLDLSTEELHFSYSLDNWEPYVDQSLVIDNPHGFPVHYEWEISSAAFTVTPPGGTIKGKSSTEARFRWALPKPNASGGQQGVAVLKLQGAIDSSKKVMLSAELPEGLLKFRERQVDSGPLPCGQPHTVTVQIANDGTREAAFRVLAVPGILCVPERGTVAPDSLFDLDVSFSCAKPGPFTSSLELEVRGGKVLKLPIKAEGVIPVVQITEQSFDFGGTYISGNVKLPLNLTNITPVMATLMCDLTSHQEFQLLLPKKNWSGTEYDVCPLQQVGMNGEMVAASGYTSKSQSRRTSAGHSRRASGSFAPHNLGIKFFITINPKKSLSLLFAYRPKHVQEHSFQLPLVVHSSGAGGEPMERSVTATGVAPRLNISKSAVDFGPRIVLRSNSGRKPYSYDLYITSNDGEGPLQLEFGSPSSNRLKESVGVFAVEPKSMLLDPEEGGEFTVTFHPRDDKQYEASLPLYLDGDLSKPYVELELAGTGKYPSLGFDCRECVLPPVPLGVTSQAVFHIENDGYDNLELNFRLPIDETHIPLSIEFPEGNLIGLAKESLPVVVSFSATQPLSFTANLEFFDEEGKRYSLPVTGSTDNCLLTHQEFMQVNLSELTWIIEDHKPLLLDASIAYDLPAGDHIGPYATSPALVRYLEATTTLGTFSPPSRLPQQLVRSRGKLLNELVEALSGRPLPAKVAKLSNNKKEAAEQLLAQYDAALLHLRAHGALLNAVKPEMLLDVEDFQRLLAARGNSATTAEQLAAVEGWENLQENFETISPQAWNAVLLQVFKVYGLARVTPKSFKSLPGIGGTALPPDDVLAGSNVYSTAESIVLAWLTINMQRVFPAAAKRVTNFDADLHNGVVLFAALASYWPGFAARKGQLRLSPAEAHDLQENLVLVVKCMQELGLAYPLSISDLEEPSARELMLLVLYLYQALPQFVPRSTLEFNCKLGEVMTREVELTNPGRRPISYTARLEGHADFSIDLAPVKIEPKGTFRLPVKCCASTSLPRDSRLVLVSRKDAAVRAATLVFLLQSRVDTRVPLRSLSTSTPLYEMQTVEVVVANPFPADCEFAVSLQQRWQPPQVPDKAGKRRAALPQPPPQPPPPAGGATSAAAGGAGPDGAPLVKMYPDSYGMDKYRLRLRQGASDKIKLSFLPFTMGTHTATLVFKDAACGEFCYEVVGDVSLPAPALEHKALVSNASGPQVVQLPLGFVNPQLEAARKLYADKHPLGKDREQAPRLKAEFGKYDRGEMTVQYTVEQSNSLMHCAYTHTLRSGTGKTGGAGGGAEDAQATASGEAAVGGKQAREAAAAAAAAGNSLPVTLRPVGTGVYPSKIILTSQFDVRVINLEVSAQCLGQSFALEMSSPARQPLLQEIPLVNTTGTPMAVQATLSGKGFSGPRDVTIGTDGRAHYPLTFCPTAAEEFKGSLELFIPALQEKNVYALMGRGVEPLAEGHIMIECQARTTTTKRVNVPNISTGVVEYKLLTDLDFVSGPETIKLAPGRTENCKITVAPPRSGTFFGSLTFQAQDGRFLWYSIEARISAPPEMGTVEVACPVHQALAVVIQINNPSTSAMAMRATYSHPALVGPSRVEAPPGVATAFEFYYAPLAEGDAEGTVTLSSDEAGEFWWRVQMHAEPAQAVRLPLMTTQLGKPAVHVLPVQNPLAEEVRFSAVSTNPRNFAVAPAELLLPGYSQGRFELTYLPGSLDAAEEATVTLQSESAGRWEYEVCGRGELPREMGATTVAAAVGTTGSTCLRWHNPFAEPAALSVALSTSAPAGTFSLLSKHPDTVHKVVAFGTLEVLLSFSPSVLQDYHAEVTVSMTSAAVADKLTWHYPVIGSADATSRSGTFKVACQSRTQVEQMLDVVLPGLSHVSRQDEFTHEVVVPEEHRIAVGSALTLMPIETTITAPTQPLRYLVTFAPQRPLNATILLVVKKRSGGRWLFDVQLAASEPEVDAAITLEAHMGRVAEAPVYLYSSSREPQHFVASFSAESPLAFDVKPSSGMLQPRPVEARWGTATSTSSSAVAAPITVRYTCKEFRTLKGRLVVQTDDQQYSYEVYGKPPEYIPPDPKKLTSTIDSRLPPELLPQRPQTSKAGGASYIHQNIKAATTAGAKRGAGTPAAK